MKINVAFDNFNKFFEDDESSFAAVPAELIRDEDGTISEIRIYNTEYEQMITIDRSGHVEALSVDEFEQSLKF